MKRGHFDGIGLFIDYFQISKFKKQNCVIVLLSLTGSCPEPEPFSVVSLAIFFPVIIDERMVNTYMYKGRMILRTGFVQSLEFLKKS